MTTQNESREPLGQYVIGAGSIVAGVLLLPPLDLLQTLGLILVCLGGGVWYQPRRTKK